MSKLTPADYFPLKKSDGAAIYQPSAKISFNSPVGTLCIAANRYGVSHLIIDPSRGEASKKNDIELYPASGSELEAAKQHLANAQQQLERYFNAELTHFTIPLAPVGSVFQHQVWQALLAQAYGQTCSYSHIATAIGNDNAVRAVGHANGANSIAILIPCHRIIGKDGSLTGYAYGVDVKQQLLDLESHSRQ